MITGLRFCTDATEKFIMLFKNKMNSDSLMNKVRLNYFF